MTAPAPTPRQITIPNNAMAPAEISAVAPVTDDQPETDAGKLGPTVEPDERDSVTAFADVADRTLHAAIARMTGGLSPAALTQAYWDWMTHLAVAPSKRMQLTDKALRKALRFGNYTLRYAAEGPNVELAQGRPPAYRRWVRQSWLSTSLRGAGKLRFDALMLAAAMPQNPCDSNYENPPPSCHSLP